MEVISSKSEKKGLNNFELKLCALVFMIIDHFGYYFQSFMSYTTYSACRMIGRLAMPIFLFFIVQGYLHTKNLKKYIFRIFIFALITQLAIFCVEYVGINIFNILDGYKICLELNVLFSFVFCIVLLYLYEKIEKSCTYLKENNDVKSNQKVYIILKNIFYFLLIALIFIFYNIVDFDYGDKSLIVCMLFYFLEKFIKEGIVVRRSTINLLCLMSIISVFIDFNNIIITFPTIFAAFLLVYYNDKTNNYKKYKYLFYTIFPLQHAILYFVSLILQK